MEKMYRKILKIINVDLAIDLTKRSGTPRIELCYGCYSNQNCWIGEERRTCQLNSRIGRM